MPVVEYMFNINDSGKRVIPGFIGDRGHWYDPATETYIGWVPDTRDFYVPDTLTILDKEGLVQRQLAIHAVTPMTNMSDPGLEETTMTDSEVRTTVETWYDAFVGENA